MGFCRSGNGGLLVAGIHPIELRAEGTVVWKHQIPSTKFQINPNYPNSKQILFGHLKLEFGVYLGFGICDLGF